MAPSKQLDDGVSQPHGASSDEENLSCQHQLSDEGQNNGTSTTSAPAFLETTHVDPQNHHDPAADLTVSVEPELLEQQQHQQNENLGISPLVNLTGGQQNTNSQQPSLAHHNAPPSSSPLDIHSLSSHHDDNQQSLSNHPNANAHNNNNNNRIIPISHMTKSGKMIPMELPVEYEWQSVCSTNSDAKENWYRAEEDMSHLMEKHADYVHTLNSTTLSTHNKNKSSRANTKASFSSRRKHKNSSAAAARTRKASQTEGMYALGLSDFAAAREANSPTTRNRQKRRNTFRLPSLSVKYRRSSSRLSNNKDQSQMLQPLRLTEVEVLHGDDVQVDHNHAFQTDAATVSDDAFYAKYNRKLAHFSLDSYLYDLNRNFSKKPTVQRLLSTTSPSLDDDPKELELGYSAHVVSLPGEKPRHPPSFNTTQPPPEPFKSNPTRKFPHHPTEHVYATNFQQLLNQKYDNKAFFLFSNTNIFRRFFIWLTNNIFFTGGILLLIVLNCVFLAMYDPLDPDGATLRNKIVAVSEYVFTTFFAVEMCMKMFSMGLIFHPYSYFRDAWNILDFSIVFLGLFSILLDLLPLKNDLTFASSFNTLRTIRILRPLRAVSTIPALRVIVSSLISSAGLLLNALFLFIFLLWIFSIIGLQLFGGSLRQYCFHEVSGEIWSKTQLCSNDWKLFGGASCPDGYLCRDDPSSTHLLTGYTSFENIFKSMLLVLQTSTMEGWSMIFDAAVDSSGYLYATFFFFVIFFCGIFIINTLISIISDAFNESSMEAEHEEGETTKIGYAASLWNDLASRGNYYYDRLLPVPQWFLSTQQFFKKYIINTVWFRMTINLLIILNTIALAAEHYNEPAKMTEILDITNIVFNSLFTVEIALKLLALGPREYISDGFNLLDFLTVFLSWVEFVASVIPGFEQTGGLSALRILRLVKIVRLFNSLSGLRKIVNALSRSLFSTLMIIILLTLYVLIFSLLGMQLYGGKLKHDPQTGQLPRTNFDSLWDAILTVFQVLSGENWYIVLYQVMEIHWVNALYAIVLYIGGNYIFLGLFAAVLIRNISQERSDEDDEVVEQGQEDDDETLFQSVDNNNIAATHSLSERKQQPREVELKLQDDFGVLSTGSASSPNMMASSPMVADGSTVIYDSARVGGIHKDGEAYLPSSAAATRKNSISSANTIELPESPFMDVEEQPTKKSIFQHFKDYLTRNPFKSDVALFVIPPNPLRRLCQRFVENFLFEMFIVIAILLSSLALAFENPFSLPDSLLVQILTVMSWVFNAIFLMEAILKIFAYGFIMHPSSYLRRSWWNVLDFFIVVLSIFNTFSSSNTFSALRSLRTMRSLRALRAARGLRLLKLKALTRVVHTVLFSFKSIFYIMLLSLLLFVIFGIMGVSLYGGKFYHCSNSSIVTRDECIGSGFKWETPPQNFDNIFNALLTLFEMSTLEGWVQVKNYCVDAVSTSHAPVRDNSPYHAVYAIVFIVFSNFIIINLFVGILIDKYALLKASDQRPDMNDEESRWYDIQQLLTTTTMESKPPKPKNPIRLVLYHICTAPAFEITIVVLTLLNAVSMSLSYYGMSDQWSFILEIISYAFNGIFTLEIVLKLMAFGIVGFFKDPWNVFDFVIQALSLFGVFMQLVLRITLATSIFRTFRVARLLKILKSARGIRALINTLVMSISSIINVLGLILVLIFIYSILGVSLFARAYVESRGVHPHSNFNTLGDAFITLLKIVTGEQWQDVMRGYMLTAPQCSPKLGNCVDHPLVAVAFFCSFVILAMFIMMNLFVAIILENYSNVLEQERSNGVSAKDIDAFKLAWNEFDSNSSGFIPVIALPHLLKEIGAPLGVAPGTSHKEILKKVHGLRLYSKFGQVSFFATLYALAEYEFGRFADDPYRYLADSARLELPNEKAVRKLYSRLYKKSSKGMDSSDNRYPNVLGYFSRSIPVRKHSKLDILSGQDMWIHVSRYFSPVRISHVTNFMGPEEIALQKAENAAKEDEEYEEESMDSSMDDSSTTDEEEENSPFVAGEGENLSSRIHYWRRRVSSGVWRFLVGCLPFLRRNTEERYMQPTFGLTLLSWVTLVHQQQRRRNERMQDLITVVNTQPKEVTTYI